MKCQININDELVKEIDNYAKAVGMSRSSLCAFLIGQGMFGITKGIEISENMLKEKNK